MRKRILGFVFAAALLAAMAVPLFGGVGTAQASGNTIRVTGDGQQRSCVILPHEAGTGAITADANSPAIDRTHPATPCPESVPLGRAGAGHVGRPGGGRGPGSCPRPGDGKSGDCRRFPCDCANIPLKIAL